MIPGGAYCRPSTRVMHVKRWRLEQTVCVSRESKREKISGEGLSSNYDIKGSHVRILLEIRFRVRIIDYYFDEAQICL